MRGGDSRGLACCADALRLRGEPGSERSGFLALRDEVVRPRHRLGVLEIHGVVAVDQRREQVVGRAPRRPLGHVWRDRVYQLGIGRQVLDQDAQPPERQPTAVQVEQVDAVAAQQVDFEFVVVPREQGCEAQEFPAPTAVPSASKNSRATSKMLSPGAQALISRMA